jgi:hypothetical protein
MATATDIYSAMKAEAGDSGVDIDDFVTTLDDRGGCRGRYVSLCRDDVLISETFEGDWIVSTPAGDVATFPSDAPAEAIAVRAIGTLLEP